jgi:predicted signal transduction protein with EAL and GGDEF domain
MFRALRAYARSEERLTHAATHDALTGLPNRAYAQDHLNSLVGRPKHERGLVALLFLDVDRFKLINDSLGHMVGDRLLVGIARRPGHAGLAGVLIVSLRGSSIAWQKCAPACGSARMLAKKMP